MKNWKTLTALTAIAGGLIISACASIGHPEGGPKDTEPPRFVRSVPAPGATDVNPRRISLYFDENLQLEDAFSKVIISPPQVQPPSVSANGHRITVDLRDTLRPNTSYTIEFADAIKDLNEGNVLDGFTLDFSTGPAIDTLRLSGMVLQARNLEPAQGMLVGVHSNLSDTAISKVPLLRVTRTNQLGQFTVRNLAPGSYRVFALNDLNRDYKWDRSEDIAFYDVLVTPEVRAITVTDTLTSVLGTDSLTERAGLEYLPNDILLTWFNEDYRAQYLADYKRMDRRRVSLRMGAPMTPDSSGVLPLPSISVVGGTLDGQDFSSHTVLQKNPTADSLVYWLRSPEILQQDSLRLSVTYLETDSLDRLTPRTDTLRVFFRAPKQKKKDDADTTAVPQEYLSIRATSGSAQELNMPLVLDFAEPVATLDSTMMRLELQRDTVWTPVEGFSLRPDSLQPLTRRVAHVNWIPQGKYRFTADSAAIHSIYDAPVKAFKHEFTVKSEDDYSGLRFRISGLDSATAVVELLSASDEVRYTAPTVNGVATLRFLTPGKYYARMFIDSNSNGIWDTGNMSQGLQPEEVYYFNSEIELKKNWDIDQDWDPFCLPLDAQKPYAIKKNRPKLKPGEKAPDAVAKDEAPDW